MILDNIDEFFGQIQQADKKQCIDNFEQTFINSPRNPYIQKFYDSFFLDQSQYSSAEKYYNDLFHEIGHSTIKELGREPKSLEQVKHFYERDELVAETSAIKLNKLTQNNFDKEKNLPYLKYYLSKFGDYKDIQKEELGKALIESDKVVELTNNKYISADKSQSISNEINKNENKLSQDHSVKSQDDIFAKALQTAHQKIENKRSILDEINKNENKLSQDHSVKSQDDIFSKAFQTAHQKIENKRSISTEKSMNKGVEI